MKPTAQKISDDMQRYYLNAYEKITARLFYAKKSPNYWKAAQQAQLLKQIAEILDKFKDKSGHFLKDAIFKLVKFETDLATGDLKEFQTATKKADQWHAEYNEKYVQQVFDDTFQHIAGQTARMEQSIKTSLRDDAKEIFRRASVDGTTRAQAYRQLRNKITNKMPDFQFIDRAGRKWDSKTYFDMLTKTVMANTMREVYANTLANEGHDLVKITQNGAKDACRKWEGKILSLTGSTPGYPTLQEATDSGEIFHPNCKHRFVAYDKEIDDLFERNAA